MTEQQASPELAEQRWAYAGRRYGSDNKLYDYFYPLHDGEKVAEQAFIYSADRSRRLIGGVYKVMATPDGTRARLKGAQYDRPLRDTNTVAGWRLASDAADSVVRARREEKGSKDDMLKCLDPLRRAYQRARTYDEQIAMELMILRYIRMSKVGS